MKALLVPLVCVIISAAALAASPAWLEWLGWLSLGFHSGILYCTFIDVWLRGRFQ